MQGSVYQLALTDHDEGKPHPHVVVLTFTGNRDCIVVPAYSREGFKINEFVELSRKDGLSDGQIFVELDNAKVIDFTSFFPAKEAYWCTARFRRMSQKAVLSGTRIGQMNEDGLLAISKSLLSLTEGDGTVDLSPSAIKSLRNLVKGLSSK
jgi:hypothetical protein